MACGNGANQIHHQRVKHQLCVTSTLPRALFGAYLPCLINILDLTSLPLLLPAGYRNCVQHNSHHPMYTGACGIGNSQGIANLRVISSVRSSNSHPDLLVTQHHQHPLFQITPVLNTGHSLSEPLQLYNGYNAI